MSFDITGLGSIFQFGTAIIDKIFPNADDANKAKLAMLQMQQTGEFKELETGLEYAKLQAQSDQGQMAVNKAEAEAGGLLNQWRPALGWVCVSAYAYNFVLMPIAIWTTKLILGDAPAMVALDTTELGVLLAGMLGIGGMRSYDKRTAVKCK
jgi:hypothetical protein